MIKALFPRHGGKSKHIKSIFDGIEEGRYTYFIDLFAGGHNVVLNYPFSSTKCLANEIDGIIYNIFNSIKNNLDDVLYLVTSLDIHFFNKDVGGMREALQLYDMPSNIKNAVFDLFRYWGAFNGRLSHNHFYKYPKMDNRIDKIQKIHQRLQCIDMYNLDWIDFLNQCEKEGILNQNTLIYVDPPYVGTDTNYFHSFTEAEDNKLHDTLANLKCDWIGTFALNDKNVNLYPDYAILPKKSKHNFKGATNSWQEIITRRITNGK